MKLGFQQHFPLSSTRLTVAYTREIPRAIPPFTMIRSNNPFRPVLKSSNLYGR